MKRLTKPDEIAIVDHKDLRKKVSPGAYAARAYATLNVDSLVIVFSVDERLPAHEIDAIQKVRSEQNASIFVAVDDGQTGWDSVMTRLIHDWLLRGKTAVSVRRRYQQQSRAVSMMSRLDMRDLSEAIRLDREWFARREAAKVADLNLWGRNLNQTLKVSLPPTGQPQAYLVVHLGRRQDDVPWIPCEPLLFPHGSELSTPLSYVAPIAARPGRPWSMRRIVCVSQAGLDATNVEKNAIENSLSWLGKAVQIESLTYEDFIRRRRTSETDVLHLSIHGPGTATEPPSLAQLSPLREAIKAVNPALVVLNACHGVQMLLDPARSPFPFPVSHLEELLGDCVDTVVTAQFPVENNRMPAIWCRAFYPALAHSGDAPIAVGWARRAVAELVGEYVGLAPVAISRPGSPLAVTGEIGQP